MRTIRCLVFLIITISLSGCGISGIPHRNVEFSKPQEAVAAFRDYCRLEQFGIDTVDIETRYYHQQVSLQFYLFTIAQAFERLDREKNAKKLYLRLLIQYPLVNDGGQLGIMAENRLRWILGDKSWIKSTDDELILSLEHALRAHDAVELAQLLSRDFGFGRNDTERFAVRYGEAVNIFTDDLKQLDLPLVEITAKSEDEKIVLKTTGWEHGNKTWYFTLHKNSRVNAWECDLAYWEKKAENEIIP